MADLLLFDASVIVDYTRGVAASKTFCEPLVHAGIAAVHPVAHAEVLVGSRDRAELAMHTEVLGAFRTVPVRNADFEHALSLITDFHLSHAVGWPDCLIAATAIRFRLPVITLNAKHFRAIKGVKVIVPY